ncbi:MAG: ATP-binding cassette domain-containing protein [Elusimicrobiota bacterium]
MNAVDVEDLQKTYRGSSGEPVRALDGVSFSVKPGQIYGLLGPNGAGKSTLIKILTTITRPTAGRAAVQGFDVVKEPLKARGRMAAVLQQTAAETMLTVADNLRVYAYLHGLGRTETARRLDAVLDEFELRDKARETAQDLSLGTKRRVQVAKVFMTDAPVIFLDEATTGMDPLMRRRVLDRIRREARAGRAVLLTTQVLSEAEELCDTVMIIHKGRTLAAGTLPELRRLSSRLFRVSLAFARPDAGLRERLQSLNPAELRVDGETAELLFKGEEAALLGRLAEVARDVPLRHFEVRGAGLEDIFVEVVGADAAAAAEARP